MSESEDKGFSATCIHCGRSISAPYLSDGIGREDAEAQGWHYVEGRYVKGWVCPKHAPLFREAVGDSDHSHQNYSAVDHQHKES